jgi:suppressor of tumorigenicity protein 13
MATTTTETLETLKHLVRCAREDTAILDVPSLAFFREWLEVDLRATIPPPKTTPTPPTDDDGNAADGAQQSDDEFRDDEMMDEDVIDDTAPAMGKESSSNEELSEADEDACAEAKSKASNAFNTGDYAVAVDEYTKAILIAPSPLTYAKRAEVLIKLRRPNAAIRDCDAALKMNPDSAKAMKIRGAACRYLGRWNDANRDLSAGLNADFDETYGEIHKKVLSVVHEMHVREGKKRAEREAKAKAEVERRRAEAAKAQADAAAAAAAAAAAGGMPGGMPSGGFPGMGGGIPGVPPGVAEKLASDPDLMKAMQNPKVMEAFQAMLSNPMSAMQYMNDPEVGPVIQKMMAAYGMPGGGMPGGGFGGMPGGGPFGGGAAGAGSSAADDVD